MKGNERKKERKRERKRERGKERKREEKREETREEQRKEKREENIPITIVRWNPLPSSLLSPLSLSVILTFLELLDSIARS
jgi:hypothetical protein